MVNHNNIFKKIGYILNELQDQYQFLSENPEQLSELELELFLANANFLSDHVQIIKKLTMNQPAKELPEATSLVEEVEPFKEELSEENSAPTFEFVLSDRSPEETVDLEEVVQDNHHEEQVDYNTQEAEDIEEYDNEVTYVEASIDEVAPEPFLFYKEVQPVEQDSSVSAPVLKEDDVNAQEIPKQTPTFSLDKVEEKIVQPSATAPKPTLNDLLAASSQKSNNYNEESSLASVTDLKNAVNLNEKLLYIKDLFNGYNLAYSEAIDIINKLPDLKSADTFLQNNYAVKNNWQAKQSTVDKFYELLRQRFPEA
ncbi:MAG: hypothetical protein H7223_02040 [Pedobacter sp.]|nr:hypothetical protein [Pedobacter sp.]